MYDMLGVIFYEQLCMATKFELIEAPYIPIPNVSPIKAK